MKIMTMNDVKRLRGSAPQTTHLARFEWANDHNAKNVLDVACPDCGAYPGKDCHSHRS